MQISSYVWFDNVARFYARDTKTYMEISTIDCSVIVPETVVTVECGSCDVVHLAISESAGIKVLSFIHGQ